MKRNFLLASLLAIAAMFTGCSQDEEIISTKPSKTYEATVLASKNDIAEILDNKSDLGTRALFVGGNSNRFATLWDAGDVVQVYKNGEKVGTLSLDDAENEKYQGTKDAYLSGELEGSFSVGDDLDLYLPSKARSYTNQDGTINGLSANYSYQMKTVKVASVNGNKITLQKANMDHRQAYLRLMLKDNDGNRLHPSQVIISTTSESANQLVTSVGENGTTMTYGDIVINTESYQGEYPGELFVALLDGGYDESEHELGGATYKFTAVVDGVVYISNNDLTWTFENGALTQLSRKMSKGTPEITMASQKKMIVGTTSTRTPDVKIGAVDISDNCTVTYSSSNTTVASVNPTTGEVTANEAGTSVITATVVATDDYSSVSASYTLTVEELTAQAVDLGLSVLWADMNVGAKSDTEVGTYFAWGETEGYTNENDYEKDFFGWNNYKWRSINDFTKYNATDGLTRLEAADDAATQNWGGNWRMPTRAEATELINNTTRTVVTDYKGISGLNGILLTSTKAGYTDKSIFLPYSKGYYGALLLNEANNVSQEYYLSERDASNPLHAWRLRINAGTTTMYTWNADCSFDRGSARVVRAVQPKN